MVTYLTGRDCGDEAPELVRCDKCGERCESVSESHWHDADGQPMQLCARCESAMDAEADYYSDPFNRDYEAARASGWSD